MSLFKSTLLIVSLLLLGVSSPAEVTPNRLVAIGDVHGDLKSFLAILQETGLTDSQGEWVGGEVTLVQTGDLIDRGPDDRAVLDLMMELERSAEKSGGRVVALLGNHEVMNATGDLRYVSAEVYQAFATNQSEKKREKAYRQYNRWTRSKQKRWGGQWPEETREQWMRTHPLGYLEHREAFSPQGDYGRWIRRRPAVGRVDEMLFMHGGLSLVLPEQLADLNSRIERELESFDRYRTYLVGRGVLLPFFDFQLSLRAMELELSYLKQKDLSPESMEARTLKVLEVMLDAPHWLINHPAGPLWNRDLATLEEPDLAPLVEQFLDRYDVSRLVVGHTPQLPGTIRARLQGKVYLIDTGLNAAYYQGGRAAALEFRSQQVRAVYLDAATTLEELAPAVPR